MIWIALAGVSVACGGRSRLIDGEVDQPTAAEDKAPNAGKKKKKKRHGRHRDEVPDAPCNDPCTCQGDCLPPQVFVVDCSKDLGGDGGDGRSWERAFAHPQRALKVAAPHDEIWIKEGTCRPLNPQESVITISPTTVSIYGGFAGSERDLSERDKAAFTVMDGDFAADDPPSDPFQQGDPPSETLDNSYHIVRIAGGARVVLDGLALRGGMAVEDPHDVDGGGVLIGSGATVWLERITCEENWAINGGCLSARDSDVRGRDLRLRRNRAYWLGGGVHMTSSALDLSEVQGVENSTTHGGALALLDSHGTVRSSLFEHNVAFARGGAIHVQSGIYELEHVRLLANRAKVGGGANAEGSTVLLKRSTFIANESHGSGGGLASWDSTLTADLTAWVGNRTSTASGGGLYVHLGEAAISNSSWSGNEAVSGGGLWSSGLLDLRQVELRDNFASGRGGGLVFMGEAAQLVNSTVIANSADGEAGGALLSGETTNVVHLVAAENLTCNSPYGALHTEGQLTLHNSLLWSALSPTFKGTPRIVTFASNGSLTGQGNCGPPSEASWNDQLNILGASPFSCSTSNGDCLQLPTSACIGGAFPAHAAAVNFDPNGLSTTGLFDQPSDEACLDAGYHYRIDETRIEYFSVEGNTAHWLTANASQCELFWSSQNPHAATPSLDSWSISPGQLNEGQRLLPETAGPFYYLLCEDIHGRPKAAAMLPLPPCQHNVPENPNGPGPHGNGPQGNGPNGKGPQGNGPQGNGPNGKGPQGNGPQSNGPNGRGPSSNGPNEIGISGGVLGQPIAIVAAPPFIDAQDKTPTQ